MIRANPETLARRDLNYRQEAMNNYQESKRVITPVATLAEIEQLQKHGVVKRRSCIFETPNSSKVPNKFQVEGTNNPKTYKTELKTRGYSANVSNTSQDLKENQIEGSNMLKTYATELKPKNYYTNMSNAFQPSKETQIKSSNMPSSVLKTKDYSANNFSQDLKNNYDPYKSEISVAEIRAREFPDIPNQTLDFSNELEFEDLNDDLETDSVKLRSRGVYVNRNKIHDAFQNIQNESRKKKLRGVQVNPGDMDQIKHKSFLPPPDLETIPMINSNKIKMQMENQKNRERFDNIIGAYNRQRPIEDSLFEFNFERSESSPESDSATIVNSFDYNKNNNSNTSKEIYSYKPYRSSLTATSSDAFVFDDTFNSSKTPSNLSSSRIPSTNSYYTNTNEMYRQDTASSLNPYINHRQNELPSDNSTLSSKRTKTVRNLFEEADTLFGASSFNASNISPESETSQLISKLDEAQNFNQDNNNQTIPRRQNPFSKIIRNIMSKTRCEKLRKHKYKKDQFLKDVTSTLPPLALRQAEPNAEFPEDQ